LDLLELGKKYYKQKEFAKALQYLSELVETDGKSVEAFFLLGNIFHSKGEIGRAIKAFKRVLSLDPEHTDASISLSVLYNDIGKYNEAQKIFQQAQERVKNTGNGQGLNDPHINKKFSDKHYELGEYYLTYGRHDEALFEYSKSIKLDPTNLEARVKVAKVYNKKGFTSKAFEELRALKNEHPEYLHAYLAMGIIHYGNGNVLEAQAEWQKVLARDPSNKQAAMYLNLSNTATETSLQDRDSGGL